MSIILEYNDQLWTMIFHTMNSVTDRMIVSIIVAGTLSALVAHYLKGPIIYICFSIAILSVNYGVMRAPVTQEKLQFALKTVASVVCSSETYTNRFEKITGCEIISQYDVIEKIYLCDDKKIKENLMRSKEGTLYKGYFHAEKRITSVCGVSLVAEFPMLLFCLFFSFFLRKKIEKKTLILIIAIHLIFVLAVSKDMTFGAALYVAVTVLVRKTIESGGRKNEKINDDANIRHYGLYCRRRINQHRFNTQCKGDCNYIRSK